MKRSKTLYVKSIFLMLFLSLSLQSLAQVSRTDMSNFSKNLDIRKSNQAGLNPYSKGALRMPYKEVDFKGVDAASNLFMKLAYPNEDERLVIGAFTTLGLDEVVFNKFMFQVFVYMKGDKELTISLLNAFCGNIELSTRIYEQYWKKNSVLVNTELTKHPITYDYRVAETQSEETLSSPKTFNIPTDSGDSLDFKDKDLAQINFSTDFVSFYKRNTGVGEDKQIWELSINPNIVQVSYPYLNGRMIDKYIVVACRYSSDRKALEILLKPTFSGEGGITYELYISWINEIKAYDVQLMRADNEERYSFSNHLRVIEKKKAVAKGTEEKSKVSIANKDSQNEVGSATIENKQGLEISEKEKDDIFKYISYDVRLKLNQDIFDTLHFQVLKLKRCNNWIYVIAKPVQKNGKPVDYSKTSYQKEIKEGYFTNQIDALLRFKNDSWLLVENEIGGTSNAEWWLTKFDIEDCGISLGIKTE